MEVPLSAHHTHFSASLFVFFKPNQAVIAATLKVER